LKLVAGKACEVEVQDRGPVARNISECEAIVAAGGAGDGHIQRITRGIGGRHFEADEAARAEPCQGAVALLDGKNDRPNGVGGAGVVAEGTNDVLAARNAFVDRESMRSDGDGERGCARRNRRRNQQWIGGRGGAAGRIRIAQQHHGQGVAGQRVGVGRNDRSRDTGADQRGRKQPGKQKFEFQHGYVVSLIWGEAGSPQSHRVMALRIVVAASACIKWYAPSLLAFRCPSRTCWKYRGLLRNPESCTREHGGEVCNSLRGRRFVEERTRLERETGIEPATSSLGSLRSTAELLPLATSTLPQRGGQHRSRARNSTHDILKALVVTARRAVSGGKIASRAHNFIIGSCRIGVGLGPGGTGAVAGCIFRPERCECAPGSAEHSKARRGRF